MSEQRPKNPFLDDPCNPWVSFGVDEENSKPDRPFEIEFSPEFKVTKKDGKIRIEIDYEKFAEGMKKYEDEKYEKYRSHNTAIGQEAGVDIAKL